MARRKTPIGHLVGAYGLFWQKDEVDWFPGSGPHAWQLLGRRNKVKPALRVCDFRQALGVYVLYDDYQARYAGLARGSGGLGARLRTHVQKPPRRIAWTRFSWYSFDDVIKHPNRRPGWDAVKHRSQPLPADSEAVIREIEALVITLLGTPQNDMRFQNADRWEQLPDWEADELGRRGAIDPRGFTFRPF